MNRIYTFLFILISTFLLTNCNNNNLQSKYPTTPTCDTIDTYFDVKVADPYRWLEDNFSEATTNWITAQNEYTNNYFEQIPYRQQMREKLEELLYFHKESTPFKVANRYFVFKNDGKQSQNVMFYKDSIDGEDILLLDPNKLSDDNSLTLTYVKVSPDGEYLAYAVSRNNNEWEEIHIKNISTKKVLDEKIEWVQFCSVAWYKDGFYYCRYPKPENAHTKVNDNNKLYYHKLGTSQSNDILTYEDKSNPDIYFDATVVNEKYLIVQAAISTSGNALYYKDLTKVNSEFVKIVDNYNNDYEVVDEISDELYVTTNYEAENWQLIKINLLEPEEKNWQIVIPNLNNGVLNNVSHIGRRFIANYTINTSSEIWIFDEKGYFLHKLDRQEIGTFGGFNGVSTDSITYYYFSSFAVPYEIYKYDINANISTLHKKSDIKIDRNNYVVKQVFYTSKDGTIIPMFIIYRKDIKIDGNTPTLLYGYGGFNVIMMPKFRPYRMAWLECGGIYAIANIRGGGEYGKAWHQAGTLFNKQKVFEDYISAAEYLIKEGYTKSEKLAIQGGANGGLLVGAAINQRPDLFAVAVPQTGIMDMLRYQNFTIGKYWSSDYGTSVESKEMFEYLYKYSPLHNIKEGKDYPAILVTTSDNDDRVVPAHSFKYAASLQNKNIGNKPHLIRIDNYSGHGLNKPANKIIDEFADIYSFMLFNMGEEPHFTK